MPHSLYYILTKMHPESMIREADKAWQQRRKVWLDTETKVQRSFARNGRGDVSVNERILASQWTVEDNICELCSFIATWTTKNVHCANCGICVCKTCSYNFPKVFSIIEPGGGAGPRINMDGEKQPICGDCLPFLNKRFSQTVGISMNQIMTYVQLIISKSDFDPNNPKMPSTFPAPVAAAVEFVLNSISDSPRDNELFIYIDDNEDLILCYLPETLSSEIDPQSRELKVLEEGAVPGDLKTAFKTLFSVGEERSTWKQWFAGGVQDLVMNPAVKIKPKVIYNITQKQLIYPMIEGGGSGELVEGSRGSRRSRGSRGSMGSVGSMGGSRTGESVGGAMLTSAGEIQVADDHFALPGSR